MLHLLPRTLLLIGVGLLLSSGCSTPSGSAREDTYQPPAPGPAVAYVKGSVISEGGLFGGDHLGFPFMVDLLPVADAAERWSEPLPVTPGHHTVGAEYRYSNFTARAHLPLDARRGVTYQVTIGYGHEGDQDGPLFCEFWIVDLSTGQRVTPVYHRQVMGGKKGTIFNVNK